MEGTSANRPMSLQSPSSSSRNATHKRQMQSWPLRQPHAGMHSLFATDYNLDDQAMLYLGGEGRKRHTIFGLGRIGLGPAVAVGDNRRKPLTGYQWKAHCQEPLQAAQMLAHYMLCCLD